MAARAALGILWDAMRCMVLQQTRPGVTTIVTNRGAAITGAMYHQSAHWQSLVSMVHIATRLVLILQLQWIGRVVRTPVYQRRLQQQLARGVWKVWGNRFRQLNLSIQFKEIASRITCRWATHSMLCLAGGKVVVAVVVVVEATAQVVVRPHPLRLVAVLHLQLGVVPHLLQLQPGGVPSLPLGKSLTILPDEDLPIPLQPPTGAVVKVLLFRMATKTKRA